MKKWIKKAVAAFLVCLATVSFASCSIDVDVSGLVEDILCEHNYETISIKKEPTCSERGKREEECSECGKVRVVTIKATGEHVDENADDTCDVCGARYLLTPIYTNDYIAGNTYRITDGNYKLYVSGMSGYITYDSDNPNSYCYVNGVSGGCTLEGLKIAYKKNSMEITFELGTYYILSSNGERQGALIVDETTCITAEDSSVYKVIIQ